MISAESACVRASLMLARPGCKYRTHDKPCMQRVTAIHMTAKKYFNSSSYIQYTQCIRWLAHGDASSITTTIQRTRQLSQLPPSPSTCEALAHSKSRFDTVTSSPPEWICIVS